MFGLMRPTSTCRQQSSLDYRQHRMHYCGTCKTMGIQFGQRSRILLNYDIVFFAELLSELSSEQLSEWQPGLQAINQCLTMPESEKHLPQSLQFAAASNVLLAALKLDDDQKDADGWYWNLSEKLFAKSFQKAKLKLNNFGVETTFFDHWVDQQEKLESKKKISFSSLQDLLAHYAEPTAQMTAYLFQEGCKSVGEPANAAQMRQLGYFFGQLIYTLDALEDLEKDRKKGQFNPFLLYFGRHKNLDEVHISKAQHIVLFYQNRFLEVLEKLPLSFEKKEAFCARFLSNSTLRIYRDRPQPINLKVLITSTKQTLNTPLSFLNLSFKKHLQTTSSFLISLLIFIFPLVADYGVHQNESTVYEHLALISVALGTIAIGKEASKKKNRRRAYRFLKKMNRKRKRFFQRLQRMATRKGDCWEDCCGACFAACTFLICEAICDKMCIAIEEGKLWPWISIFMVGVAIAAVIIFV